MHAIDSETKFAWGSLLANENDVFSCAYYAEVRPNLSLSNPCHSSPSQPPPPPPPDPSLPQHLPPVVRLAAAEEEDDDEEGETHDSTCLNHEDRVIVSFGAGCGNHKRLIEV
jgi:hypothetical protein